MPQRITDKAILKCNQGTITSNLTVTSQHFYYAEDKLVALEEDKIPMVNIMPFGQCRLKPSITGYLPCTPAPIAWQQTPLQDVVNGMKILTEESICPCATGGTISVQYKGYDEIHGTDE